MDNAFFKDFLAGKPIRPDDIAVKFPTINGSEFDWYRDTDGNWEGKGSNDSVVVKYNESKKEVVSFQFNVMEHKCVTIEERETLKLVDNNLSMEETMRTITEQEVAEEDRRQKELALKRAREQELTLRKEVESGESRFYVLRECKHCGAPMSYYRVSDIDQILAFGWSTENTVYSDEELRNMGIYGDSCYYRVQDNECGECRSLI